MSNKPAFATAQILEWCRSRERSARLDDAGATVQFVTRKSGHLGQYTTAGQVGVIQIRGKGGETITVAKFTCAAGDLFDLAWWIPESHGTYGMFAMRRLYPL